MSERIFGMFCNAVWRNFVADGRSLRLRCVRCGQDVARCSNWLAETVEVRSATFVTDLPIRTARSTSESVPCKETEAREERKGRVGLCGEDH